MSVCGAVRCGAVRCGAALAGLLPGLACALPLYLLSHVDYVASERLTSAAIYPSEYQAVEVPNSVPGVAWVRSSGSRTIRIALTNPTQHFHQASLILSDFKFVGLSGTYTLTAFPPYQQLTFPPFGQSNIAEFVVQGLPNHVTLGQLTFDLACISQWAVLNGDDLGAKIWLTDATPVGATHGRQIPAWTNVLDDACTWASGQVGPEACRFSCTDGLYFSGTFNYNPYEEPKYLLWDNIQDPPIRQYRLRAFFSDRASPPELWVIGDCQDISTYLQIVLSAIGVTIETRQLKPAWPLGFLTNHLCPPRSNPTQLEKYRSYDFGMHQPCFVSETGPVYDPTIAHWRDLSGSLYQAPPKNWPWSGYWQVDHRPSLDEFGSGFWGLTRSRVPVPRPPEGEPVPVYAPTLVSLAGLL